MEDPNYLRALLAFLFVIGLIGGMHFLLKRFGWEQRLRPERKGRRLAVVESVMIDPRHKLALVRRDGVEHLLLLGHQSDRVVETGIQAEQAEEKERI